MVLLNVYIIFESVAVDIFTLLDELPYDFKRLYIQSQFSHLVVVLSI